MNVNWKKQKKRNFLTLSPTGLLNTGNQCPLAV